MREESQGPKKRHAPQITHEQRGISDRSEQATDIRDDEDKEDGDVGSKPPFTVRPQEGSDQEHAGTRCPEDIGDDAAEAEEEGVIAGCRLDIAAQEYPT